MPPDASWDALVAGRARPGASPHSRGCSTDSSAEIDGPVSSAFPELRSTLSSPSVPTGVAEGRTRGEGSGAAPIAAAVSDGSKAEYGR